jgi:hypothetical protein
VVPARAAAYSESGGRYQTLMPFENVHGNGGLLTTVGDLLKWNHNFATHVVGDEAFVREQEAPGRFNDGRAHGYALGLMVGTRYGLREVAHSGSTAGYTAHLTRFPDQQLSVAVLCNSSNGGATQAANRVAAIYLGDRARTTPVTAKHKLTAAETAGVVGLYRSGLNGEAANITATADGIRIERGTQFVPVSATQFVSEAADTLVFEGGRARLTDRHGSVENFDRTQRATPTPAELAALAGVYVSDEAETTLTVAVEQGALVLKRRPDTVIALSPLYQDAFSGSIGTVIFRRGATMELSVVQDRVWDLRFTKRERPTTTSQP